MFRKILSSVIILPLLVVPLFCCCIKQVHASGVEHCQDQDEHSGTSHHSDADHSTNNCDCRSLSIAVENTATFQVALLAFHSFFATLDGEGPSLTFTKGSLRLAYLGPPLGSQSAVPLYIQYHSLRI